jgi:hypothetical protein
MWWKVAESRRSKVVPEWVMVEKRRRTLAALLSRITASEQYATMTIKGQDGIWRQVYQMGVGR